MAHDGPSYPKEKVMPTPNSESAYRPKVLVIEDTIEIAEIVCATLQRMNLQVSHATHGDKGLELYQTEQPDLVLLDIGLPDTTGWKVLETIRHQMQEGGKRSLVIVITAYGDPANRLMGKLQGIFDYLIKPLIPSQIEKVVAHALDLPQN